MDEMKRVDFLNFPLMTPEEINSALLELSEAENFSPELKNNLRSEMVDILKHDQTGLLLLPFRK